MATCRGRLGPARVAGLATLHGDIAYGPAANNNDGPSARRRVHASFRIRVDTPPGRSEDSCEKDHKEVCEEGREESACQESASQKESGEEGCREGTEDHRHEEVHRRALVAFAASENGGSVFARASLDA